MLIHPLTLALSAADLAAVVLLALAAWHAAAVAAGWRPGAADAAQLRLERRAEASAVLARWGAALVLLAGLMLVLAVAGALPAVVPGAMCGTGVVQATGGAAGKALALRLLALLLLALWRAGDRLDHTAARSPLAQDTARLLLLAAPVAAVAALATGRALASLDVHTPVDCCAAVFDTAVSTREATTTWGLSDAALLWLAGAGAVLLAAAAVGARRGRRAAAVAGALLALVWTPLAATALVRVLAAYHYGVLHHHCPWCLLLARHRLVGYPLFGSLLVVLLEAVAAALVLHWGRREGVPSGAAAALARAGAGRLLLALLVFALLCAAPPLWWRWTHGVWLTG